MERASEAPGVSGALWEKLANYGVAGAVLAFLLVGALPAFHAVEAAVAQSATRTESAIAENRVAVGTTLATHRLEMTRVIHGNREAVLLLVMATAKDNPAALAQARQLMGELRDERRELEARDRKLAAETVERPAPR